MGFDRPRRTYRLAFEGDLAGLEVLAKSVGLGDYMAISELASVTMPLTAAGVTKFRKLLKAFADALLEWNLEEYGKPVPATSDGLMSLEPDLVLRIVFAWMEAVAGAVVPSQSAEPFPEESLPMDPLPTP